LPMSEVFSGNQLDDLIKTVETAVRDSQTLITEPLLVSVNAELDTGQTRFLHTIVPIIEPGGAKLARLFLFSEKVDG